MMPAWRPVTPSSRRWEKYRSGEQLLRPVLAHQLDARVRQSRQGGGLHVLNRSEDLDLGADLLPHPLEVAPYPFRIHRAR